MAYEAETRLYDNEVLTGRFYHDAERPAYDAEKRGVDEMPDQPLAERYQDPDAEWERSVDELLGRHT
jgi:pyruvate ferredoxin oxidoreductase beta subunit